MGDKSKYRKSRKRSRKSTSFLRRKKQNGGDEVAERSPSTSEPKVPATPEARSAEDETGLVHEGFILLDLKQLCMFFRDSMKCRECLQIGSLSCAIDLDSKMGFCHDVIVKCSECLWSSKFRSSSSLRSSSAGGQPMKEVNTRMVSFVRAIGRGYSALESFCLSLNSPAPMTSKNYKKVFRRILAASRAVAIESMTKAADEYKTWDSMSGTGEEAIDCSVSVDGTWQRRGHGSHHGVVTSILVETAKCVDVEILSNICKGCSYWEQKDKTSQEYNEWKVNHCCKINHKGSAAAMEPVGAVRIFQRSEMTRNLRYTKYLGDGDSSSFKKVVECRPYGDKKIEKLECVGHVQKRCGTRLRRLKNANKGLKLSDGRGLSGAGRLTDKCIDTLQNYYGFAIRQNSGNLDKMKEAVSAVLPHVSSSGTNPMHDKCPEGENSWCGYKRNPATYKHRKGIPKAVADFIQPVFNDLSSSDLLSKCLHGKTQNVNECLNKLIWDRCSKDYFVERDVLEEAVYSAVSHFNDGRTSILNLFQKLGIDAGRFTAEHCKQQDHRRHSAALSKSSEKEKRRRKLLRARRKGFQDRQKESEGNVYEAGGH